MWTVEEGISRLREGGAKITSQRIAFLRLLKDRTDHPSADQIYNELRENFSTISYATIYSTAQLLAKADLLQILSIDDKRVHFDPNPKPHGHFRCQSCGELFDFPETFCEMAGECGHRSFTIMAGCFDGLDVTAEKLSYEGPFGVGYGVCLCLPEEADGRKEAHDIRVRLARDSIAEYLKTGKLPKPPADIPEELKERAGVFVSLHEFGALRGCIGTILPVRNSAAEEIIHNAKAAASEDPRFPPVNPYELDDLDISVDVLSAPEPISSEGDLDPKIYGVIVERGFRRGLLLPDLPGITDPREQVEIARRKAGIGADEPVKMYRFTVRRYY